MRRPTDRRRHRIAPGPILILLVVVWTPVLYNAVPRSLDPRLLAPILSPVLLSLILLWFFAVVEQSAIGLRLFRGPVLPWAEIRGLRRRTVLGLPFMLLYRPDRPPVWLPLFVSGREALEQRLEQHWRDLGGDGASEP